MNEDKLRPIMFTTKL